MSIEPVLHSFVYSLDYLRAQVADVTEADLVAQPPGSRNHPAWTIGHLTFACQAIGGAIGLAPWLPVEFSQRHGPGSQPLPDAAAYSAKADGLEALSAAQARVTEAASALSAARLEQIFPVESYRPVFPTIRHALAQVLIGHTAYHVGQVALWRHAMGLKPVGRSYE